MITEKEIIKTYKEYCETFDNIALCKTKELNKLREETESKVVREEYCCGSDMSLGYYNPSPVLDLVVGNMHRGKLLKKFTKLSKPTHKYGFDKNGKLLVVNRIMPKELSDFDYCAILEYDENIVTIISIRKTYGDIEIGDIALCEYDKGGRLIKLTEGYHPDGEEFTSIYQEIYTYNNCGVDTLTMFSCNEVSEDDEEFVEVVAESSRKHDVLKERADKFIDSIERTGCMYGYGLYRFFHDEEGYITSYEVFDEYDESTMYKVAKRKRRKV